MFKIKQCPFDKKGCVGSFCAIWDPLAEWCRMNALGSIDEIPNHFRKLNALIDTLISEIISGNKGEK